MTKPLRTDRAEGRETAIVTFELLEYWHAGSGESGSGDLDLTVVRDESGLPYLPGKTVKGLLRDAVRLAEELGHVPPATVDDLFGRDALSGPDGSTAGNLRFDSAKLPDEFRAEVKRDTALRCEIEGLFEVLSSTAMDDSGVALEHSLRRVEAVMPVSLSATIQRVVPGPGVGSEPWIEILRKCAPLVRRLGVARHRGLGRCRCVVARPKGEVSP